MESTALSMDAARAKLDHLRGLFRDMGSVVVAYSGGLDSAFVLSVAHGVLAERALALTAVSPSLPQRERDDAERIARRLGVEHELIGSNEIHNPDYASNPANRCFHCKSELYTITERVRSARGFAHVANGTNVDDLGDYRPGLEAAKNAGVRSPLVEANLHKHEVRALAQELGLDFWDKPAAACLSSRIPYGTAVTPARLSQVEQLEDALHALGLRQVRVRYHDELARIEVGQDELERAFAEREAITRAGKSAGFAFVTLDLLGYRTGSLNQLLRVIP
jgi:uncharacterized protein